MRIFRWRGVAALAAILLLIAGWWILFGERTIKSTLEESATESLGAQVDIAHLDIDLSRTSLVLEGIAIADPFDSTRNLVEATGARIELELEPLLQKKIVIRNLALSGIQTGTLRATPARSVDTTGFAPRALRELRRFREQIDVPLLSLTPIDTIRSLVLDPMQLRTVQSAIAVQLRGDSLRDDIGNRMQRLLEHDIVDSAQKLINGLKGQTARTLGVAGALRAASDVRRVVTRVDSLKRAVDILQRDLRLGFDSLSADVRSLDAARRADYEFAKSLIALPTIDAPSIGPALFGDVSIGAFEKAAYWLTLAQEHAPPGLRPRKKSGPQRLRRAGTTVHFVTPASYPNFLLRKGEVALSLGGGMGAARGDYVLNVQNLTTEPALTGEPMRFDLHRSATGSGSDIQSIDVVGAFDHSGERARDNVDVLAKGIRLPAFALPGIPLRVDLGQGSSTLRFAMLGDSINATWSIGTTTAEWHSDSARMQSQNTLERLVSRVLSGIRAVDVEAELTGTLATPKLSVRSTLDREVAASIRNVAGEEIAKAERLVRAQVDSIVDERVAPIRARISELRKEAEARVSEITSRLDALREQLNTQLRALGGIGDSLPYPIHFL